MAVLITMSKHHVHAPCPRTTMIVSSYGRFLGPFHCAATIEGHNSSCEGHQDEFGELVECRRSSAEAGHALFCFVLYPQVSNHSVLDIALPRMDSEELSRGMRRAGNRPPPFAGYQASTRGGMSQACTTPCCRALDETGLIGVVPGHTYIGHNYIHMAYMVMGHRDSSWP